MRWTLRLVQTATDGRVQTFVTTWFDGNESRLPREFAAIKDIAWRAGRPAPARCG
jgi:hypothetical protein